MEKFFAYVLYVEETHDDSLRRQVSIHRTLDEAEDALRAYTRTIYVRFNDDEIIEALAAEDVRTRIFACTEKRDRKRYRQSSIELQPFARSAEVA